MAGWSRPKDQQNRMDNFLSVTGTLYVIVKYQKDKVRHLHGFDVRTAETLEEHRQAIQE